MAEEEKKQSNDRADMMKERIKPLPESAGLDDEQLRQLCRELHAAIDKVSYKYLSQHRLIYQLSTTVAIFSFIFYFKADEQRYDADYKIEKHNKETDELKRKHAELKGGFLHKMELI